MRLLIITQAVDTEDPTLGFFHEWIREFSKICERIHVVCLREGLHTLPSSVDIHSLGKESGLSRFFMIVRFFKYIVRYRKEYDAVFIHMNPEYAVLGGVFFRLFRKKVGVWHTHKSVPFTLRIANILAHYIFTASSESLRLPSKKTRIVGHGIPAQPETKKSYTISKPLRLITVGRISRTKRIKEILEVQSVLKDKGIESRLTILGAPIYEKDCTYEREAQAFSKAKRLDVVWQGGVSHGEISKHLTAHDIFISMSTTGSLDKAILEAMASGIPVVTTNPGAKSALSQAGAILLNDETGESCVRAILDCISEEEGVRRVRAVRASLYVEEEHSLPALASRIVGILQEA